MREVLYSTQHCNCVYPLGYRGRSLDCRRNETCHRIFSGQSPICVSFFTSVLTQIFDLWQSAAGVLTFLLDHILPLIHLSSITPNPPSPDLSKLSITALISFSLAQAQECFFQKAVADHLKNGSIAKVATKVGDYYAEALNNAIEARGTEGVWPTWSFPTVSIAVLF